MPYTSARLVITDGTTEISLINNENTITGFYLSAWRPSIPGYKGGGVWQQSSLSDGRRLTDKHFTNIIDTLSLKSYGFNQDYLIREMQDIRRLLEKASDYWKSGWSTEPVWIEARAVGETNLRYSVIYSGRIAEDENPYSQPFLQTCSSVMDNLTLVIEHGFWTDQAPGSSSVVSFCEPYYYYGGPVSTPIYFDGSGDGGGDDGGIEGGGGGSPTTPGEERIDYGSDAGIDDIPDFAVAGRGQITAEIWFKFDAPASANQWFFQKGVNVAPALGCLHMMYRKLGALGQFEVRLASAGAASGILVWGDPSVGFPAFPNTDWHHLLMTYDETGAATPVARTVYLACDGVWATSYVLNVPTIGNYISDAAFPLIVGNADVANGMNNAPLIGNFGWFRLSDNVRYPVGPSFTPDDREVAPAPDVNTLVTTLYSSSGGTGGTAESLGTVAPTGTLYGGFWDTEETVGSDDPCDTLVDTVYIANKRNMADISDIYIDDGGVSSANLVWETAYELFPTVPVANDAIYFGVDTSVADTGPFCSLVFDLGVAGAGYTATWEYWDGGAPWGTLTVFDNTDTAEPLDTAGVGSVHWEHPSDWVEGDLSVIVGAHMPAVTGYWVRCRITGVPGALTAPQQQNRFVYTVLQPYIEITEEEIGGDIPALSEIIKTSVVGLNLIDTNRVCVGLRSLSRGEDFTAIINLVDEQNPTGITITPTSGVQVADMDSSTALSMSIGGAPTGSPTVQVLLDSNLTQQYRGTFKAFLRARTATAPATNCAAQLSVFSGISPFLTLYTSPQVLFETGSTGWTQLLDMGTFSIPASPAMDDVVWENFRFSITHYRYAGSGSTYYTELILIPVDEWAAEILPSEESLYQPYFSEDIYLRITSLLQKDFPLSAAIDIATNEIWGVPITLSNGPSIYQARSAQRLWFISGQQDHAQDWGPSNYFMCSTVAGNKVQRYLSMRGDR